MVKTLVKHGNSYALVIDRPILELLNITPDTPLEVSTSDGQSLMVRPALDDVAARSQRVAEAHEWIMKQYDGMFARLAGKTPT
jgi:antitoxin component of MazEF toxin-antitoxin module